MPSIAAEWARASTRILRVPYRDERHDGKDAARAALSSVNRQCSVAQAAAAAAGAHRDEFRGNRNRGLFGGSRSDIESDRTADACERRVVDPRLAQQGEAVFVRAPASHRADIARRRAERGDQQRNIELDVVREHYEDRARVDRGALE